MIADFAAGTIRLGPADAGEVLTLQLAAWVREGRAHDTIRIPPLLDELPDVETALRDPAVTAWGYRARSSDADANAGPVGRLLAMARTSLQDDGQTAFIGRLGVVPDLRGRGYGGAMLAVAEDRVPDSVERFELITGHHSYDNHAFYLHHGYTLIERDSDGEVDPFQPPGTVLFRKERVSKPS